MCFYVREKEREREYVCVCVCVSGCKESVRFWVGKREQEQLVEPEKALYYKKMKETRFLFTRKVGFKVIDEIKLF